MTPDRPDWIREAWEPGDAAAIADRLREEPTHPFLATGKGTTLRRGGKPRRPVIALGTGRLDRVVEHAAEDLTVTVQAGVSLETLNALLAGRNQWLPPAAGDRGTVGGLIAADRRNLWAGGHGSVRDYLLGVEFLDGRGACIRAGGRVVKNVAGYDLMKLLIGSLGSFGIVTEATFKVLPRPELRRTFRHPHEPPGPEGLRLMRVLDTVHPAGLWRIREGGSDGWVLTVAGNPARVAAEATAVRSAWGPGTEELDPAAWPPPIGAPTGTSVPVWGGALPAFLAGSEAGTFADMGSWRADLLGGHLWGEVPADLTVPALAALRRALLPGEGHLHLDDEPGRARAVWGRNGGETTPLLSALKQVLDPGGRLVSGRLPGGV